MLFVKLWLLLLVCLFIVCVRVLYDTFFGIHFQKKEQAWKKNKKQKGRQTKNRVKTTNHGRLKCLSLQWHCRCLLQIHMFRQFFPLSIQKHVNVLCHWIYGPWILRGMAIYVLKSALFIKYSVFSLFIFFSFRFSGWTGAMCSLDAFSLLDSELM